MSEKQSTKTESNFRKLRRELSKMSFEDKIDHIWRYYKINLILLVLIPAILIPLLTSVFVKGPESILYGNYCNVALGELGQYYVTRDYVQYKGLPSEEYIAELEFSVTEGLGMSSASAQGVDSGLGIVAAVAVDSLDYIVCDEVAAEYLSLQQCFLTLDRVLTEEQLEEYKHLIYTYTDPDFGDTYAVALDVSEIPFFRENVETEGPCYFAFANKKEADAQELREFLSYLLDWEAWN